MTFDSAADALLSTGRKNTRRRAFLSSLAINTGFSKQDNQMFRMSAAFNACQLTSLICRLDLLDKRRQFRVAVFHALEALPASFTSYVNNRNTRVTSSSRHLPQRTCKQPTRIANILLQSQSIRASPTRKPRTLSTSFPPVNGNRSNECVKCCKESLQPWYRR